MLEDDEHLEYLVYGWFKFLDLDAEGVCRLGRQYVSVEGMAEDKKWVEMEEAFDARVRDMRAPFQ